MTEMELRPDDAPEQHELSKLGRWAQDARDAHIVATSLAKTSFVPKEMQGKPELVTAAILTGQEIGLEPMASLRSIDVIQGTPAMRSHALRGLVQSAGHEVWVHESTESRAIVKGRRKDSDKVQESRWTTDRADKMGLLGRDSWKKQPGAMLIARATAELCRLVASDVLLGMPYAVEELDESEAKPARKVKRKPVERTEPETPALTPAVESERDEPDEPALEDEAAREEAAS